MSNAELPAEITGRLQEWGASDAVPLEGGAYRLVPADPCPCGAFSRSSKWHLATCRDRVAPDGAS